MKNLLKALAVISMFIGVGTIISYIPVSKESTEKKVYSNKVNHEGWQYAYIVSSDTADKLYNNKYVDPSEIELTDVYIKWHNKRKSTNRFEDRTFSKIEKKILPISSFYGKKPITLKEVMDNEVNIMENIGLVDDTKERKSTFTFLNKKEFVSTEIIERKDDKVQIKPSTNKLKGKNKEYYLSVINGVTEETFFAKPSSYKGAEITQ